MIELEDNFLSFESSLGDDDAKSKKGVSINKLLEDSVQLIVKSQPEKIIEVVTRYGGKSLAKTTDLELLVRAGLDTAWKSQGGDWDLVYEILYKELATEIDEKKKWTKAAIAAANEISISGLKEIMKSQGEPDSRIKGKSKKSEIIDAVIEIVKIKQKGNMKYVANFLRAEADKKKTKTVYLVLFYSNILLYSNCTFSCSRVLAQTKSTQLQ